MLFFGHLRTSMNHNEFVSAMGLIGVFGAIHMFSWLVVFQFRKNLLEEQRLMARLVASAPLPPGNKKGNGWGSTYTGVRSTHFST